MCSCGKSTLCHKCCQLSLNCIEAKALKVSDGQGSNHWVLIEQPWHELQRQTSQFIRWGAVFHSAPRVSWSFLKNNRATTCHWDPTGLWTLSRAVTAASDRVHARERLNACMRLCAPASCPHTPSSLVLQQADCCLGNTTCSCLLKVGKKCSFIYLFV